jgi:hypothetical protein
MRSSSKVGRHDLQAEGQAAFAAEAARQADAGQAHEIGGDREHVAEIHLKRVVDAVADLNAGVGEVGEMMTSTCSKARSKSCFIRCGP